MRVMVLVKATEASEKENAPKEWMDQMFDAMGKFNDELKRAGVMIMGEGLTPSSQGKRVAFHGTKRTVTDGPFTETHELVAGFWIWEVKDLDEALAWVKRCPNPMPGPSDIEIRPIGSLDDVR
jgi:hypothetical protein